jgi:hypothetical protein
MGLFAVLAPVSPFVGLSASARREIGKRFPSLSILEIEQAAERFSLELHSSITQGRLLEARTELAAFADELVRFKAAVQCVRDGGLDRAIGRASSKLCGEDEMKKLDRQLGHLQSAVKKVATALPAERAQLATRRFIGELALQMNATQIPISSSAGNALVNLIQVIFDDLMVGGDPESAVKDWRKQLTDLGHGSVAELTDPVISPESSFSENSLLQSEPT